MVKEKRIGLALSGGGYRAAAFHLGTLRKLNELGLLKNVDVFSCISGGAIIGAYYCLNSDKPFKELEKSLIACLKKSVISRLIIILVALSTLIIGLIFIPFILGFKIITYILLFILVILFFNFQFVILPVSTFVEHIYSNIFFKNQSFKDLKNKPVLLINATNLETGRLWTFSQEKMGDSSYKYRKAGEIKFRQENFPISRAVASSTCVPYAFSPIKIEKHFFSSKEDFSKISPRLIDGGVYDNQGVHKITQPNSSYNCDIIIVSDAGMKFSNKSIFGNNFTLLQRTSNIFMHRIKNLQFQNNVYFRNLNPFNEIAYLSLGWDVDNCISGFINNLKSGNISKEVQNYHKISTNDIEEFNTSKIRILIEKNINYPSIKEQVLDFDEKFIAQNVSTNLTSLSDEVISYLSNHASVITEIQLKLYCPSLFISE